MDSTNSKTNTEWRSQIEDQKNFDTKSQFDYNKLFNHFEKVKADIEHINPYEFLAGTFEIMKGFMKLGSGISMGFSDISTKVERWRQVIIKDMPDKDLNDLQAYMDKEISLNIHTLNGDNNSDLGHKKKSQYHKYISGTRTLLRLNWFIHFISTILKNMLNTTDGFSTCLKHAYTEVLAPHHSWLIKKSVGVAFSFATSKRGPALMAFFGKNIY